MNLSSNNSNNNYKMDIDLLELDPIPLDEASEDKFAITVEYDGKKTQVSWYKGMNSTDIEDAILCACDSIIDQGFTLTDSSGFPVSFGEIIPEGHYLILPGNEIKGKEKIMGDRLRRITIEIPPMKHIEAVRAIEIMKNGSNLLKHTRNSMPHIRLFQLTENYKHLMWYSSGKSQEKASLLIENIYDIKLGQLTETFINYPIPALEHLSFSLIHTKGSLDITCRDEREFDFWVIGFKALIFQNKELLVSKQILISHSRRFIEFLKQNKFYSATEALYKEPETKKLEECIVRKSMSREDISAKLMKIHNKLTNLTEKILDLPNDIYAYDVRKESLDVYGGEYNELFLDDDNTEELFHTEQQRVTDLNSACRTKLVKLETEFANKFGVPEHHDTAEFEIELWRLEVDVENLNDVVKRIERSTEGKWGKKLKSWIKDLF